MVRPSGGVAVADRLTKLFGATTCEGCAMLTAGATRVRAAYASRMPAPHLPTLLARLQAEPAGCGRAEARSIDVIWVGVSAPFMDSISAITPLTCGVAMLVPVIRA